MLPIEICEAAIDQASDNTPSLRQLSLTCRAFLSRSRYHLFGSIVLRTVGQMQSSREFLDSCPWVLPLVQKVTLTIDVLGHHIATFPNIPLLESVPMDLLIRLPNIRRWEMSLTPTVLLPRGKAALSLHRSVLSYYRRYGGRLRDLELSNIPFDSISDFIGLVSEITGIQHLACSFVLFRTMKGPSPALYGSGKTMLFKSLAIKNLHVSVHLFVGVHAHGVKS